MTPEWALQFHYHFLCFFISFRLFLLHVFGTVYMILMGVKMTLNVHINMTPHVRIYITPNVRIYMTTKVQQYDFKCATLYDYECAVCCLLLAICYLIFYMCYLICFYLLFAICYVRINIGDLTRKCSYTPTLDKRAAQHMYCWPGGFKLAARPPKTLKVCN